MNRVAALHRSTGVRMWMMRRVRGTADRAYCDYCGKPSRHLEKHEIVNKGKTIGNEEARLLSEDAMLSSLLCQACHARAEIASVRLQLIAWNVWFYGRSTSYEEACREIMDKINDIEAVTLGGLGMYLPDEEVLCEAVKQSLTSTRLTAAGIVIPQYPQRSSSG